MSAQDLAEAIAEMRWDDLQDVLNTLAPVLDVDKEKLGRSLSEWARDNQ